jgi:hypothetical protein
MSPDIETTPMVRRKSAAHRNDVPNKGAVHGCSTHTVHVTATRMKTYLTPATAGGAAQWPSTNTSLPSFAATPNAEAAITGSTRPRGARGSPKLKFESPSKLRPPLACSYQL